MSVLLQGALGVPGGYGWSLLSALISLVAVSGLAWLFLRFGLGPLGRVRRAGGRMRVIERLALEPRRSLFLVEVGGRTLLLGTGDGGAPQLIADLTGEPLPMAEGPRTASFSQVLERWRTRPSSD